MSPPWIDRVLERGVVPDVVLRAAIRQLVGRRLRAETRGGDEAIERRQRILADSLRQAPIAVATDDANDQHYELPTEFFQLVLGARMKYSGAYWPAGVRDLDMAEERMLEESCRRAQLADGQEILELGCGWGSLTLWMAEHFPRSRIVAVSNSHSQRRHIETELERRNLTNVTVQTCDINDFAPRAEDGSPRRFDRIVSVEMFEHVRNYAALFERLASWLRADGRIFVHVFCHRRAAYLFEDTDGTDWMARHFFTGGTMPAVDLFDRFDDHLEIERRWLVPGEHYQKTAEAWLERFDRWRPAIDPILERTYGAQADRFRVYWRVFFLACAELFGYRHGEEWLVCHYRMRRLEAPKRSDSLRSKFPRIGSEPSSTGGVGSTAAGSPRRPTI